MTVQSKTEMDTYGCRKKVYVDILAGDEKGNPVKADLSMSVFMTDSLQPSETEDITSYLWLSSDLKGKVTSPSYYFKDTGKSTGEQLDDLMLTHGWRRFSWDDITKAQKPSFEFAPEYEGHIIKGRVTDKRSGLPAANITTYLTVPGDRYQLSSSISNAKGLVQFDIRNFYSTPEIIVETGNADDSIYRLDIASPFSEKFSGSRFDGLDVKRNLQNQLITHSLMPQVQNAFVTDSLQRFNMPVSWRDSTVFFGQPDRKYFLDDYTRFITMEEVMREYVTGTQLRKQQGKFHIRVMDEGWHDFFPDDPLVLLDGLPVLNTDRIMTFDPFKIKKLEVMSRQYFLGPVVADGILSYTTYKGDLGGFELDPNSVILEYEGLQLQREFYSPVYDTPEQAQSRVPDFRNVLYWSPDIKTDAHGRKQISFFTADLPGKYTICIQGITADGRTGSSLVDFEVVK